MQKIDIIGTISSKREMDDSHDNLGFPPYKGGHKPFMIYFSMLSLLLVHFMDQFKKMFPHHMHKIDTVGVVAY